jgi:hypothetical protein
LFDLRHSFLMLFTLIIVVRFACFCVCVAVPAAEEDAPTPLTESVENRLLLALESDAPELLRWTSTGVAGTDAGITTGGSQYDADARLSIMAFPAFPPAGTSGAPTEDGCLPNGSGDSGMSGEFNELFGPMLGVSAGYAAGWSARRSRLRSSLSDDAVDDAARLELPARNRLGRDALTPLTASCGGKCCCPGAGECAGRSASEVYGTAGQAACWERSSLQKTN